MTSKLNGNIKTCAITVLSQPNIVSVTVLLPSPQPAAMRSQYWIMENASTTSLYMQAQVPVLKLSDSRQLLELKMSYMNISTLTKYEKYFETDIILIFLISNQMLRL
jgi:hypothetical protein